MTAFYWPTESTVDRKARGAALAAYREDMTASQAVFDDTVAEARQAHNERCATAVDRLRETVGPGWYELIAANDR
jgi:hypothetical protein